MTSCNYETDYSTVIGERILPFVFSLNTETSVLTPKPGEYQRFCYDIAGVGTDTPLYADLSHFLLGICSAITPGGYPGCYGRNRRKIAERNLG